MVYAEIKIMDKSMKTKRRKVKNDIVTWGQKFAWYVDVLDAWVVSSSQTGRFGVGEEEPINIKVKIWSLFTTHIQIGEVQCRVFDFIYASRMYHSVI